MCNITYKKHYNISIIDLLTQYDIIFIYSNKLINYTIFIIYYNIV